MQQITFTVPDQEIARKVLSSLKEWISVSNLQVTNIEEPTIDKIIPAEKQAESVEDLLVDWTDF